MPYVIKYNAHEPEAMHRYADIARRVGLGGTSEKAQVNALIAKIEEFNRAMNIPKTLQEFGVKEDEFKEKLSSIAELAVGDACTGSNPRSITPEQMEKIVYLHILRYRSRFLMKKLFVLQKAHRKMCFLSA